MSHSDQAVSTGHRSRLRQRFLADRTDAVVERARGAIRAALLDKANLLASPALRERLAQGAGEPFIAGLLAAGTPEEIASYLERTLGQTFGVPEAPKVFEPVELLRRYLKKLRVRKVRLADFRPSKHTLEKGDVNLVVAEFRCFLAQALQAGKDELAVLELLQ